jgi:hypothetical protein
MYTAASTSSCSQAHCTWQVLFIYRPYGSRRILNQQQVLQLCNAWQPEAGGFKRAHCRVIEFKDGAFVENLAMLQAAHVLVRHRKAAPACTWQSSCRQSGHVTAFVGMVIVWCPRWTASQANISAQHAVCHSDCFRAVRPT